MSSTKHAAKQIVTRTKKELKSREKQEDTKKHRGTEEKSRTKHLGEEKPPGNGERKRALLTVRGSSGSNTH